MKKTHRLLWQKLLIVSLLFFQFSLAFHSHDRGDGLHCESCVSPSAHQHHATADDETHECVFNIFYQANLASAPVDIVPAIAALDPFAEPISYAGIKPSFVQIFPLGSRAPPLSFI